MPSLLTRWKAPQSLGSRLPDIVQLARHIELERLRDVGFSAIFVGCESGSDRMLKLMTKNATVQDTIDGCRLLSAAGIIQLTSWIHDLPEETEEDRCPRSLSRAITVDDTYAEESPLATAPGSPRAMSQTAHTLRTRRRQQIRREPNKVPCKGAADGAGTL
ncbi:radical SAM protein [Streptomyces sp. NPDC014889]|uniref:radical SAM protein n=1 Tax=Streptomyces sp. NPDC014889 TaxID=3364928 RepID=UPI0036F83C8E